MRQSGLLTKTRHESKEKEESKNADLLIRAGYINKVMSGVYEFLPLGLMSLKKIMGTIREEMNTLGAFEVLFSGLQSKTVWEQTNRWKDERENIWFYSNLNHGGETGLGWTHEEPVVECMKHHINSYKDLPKLMYQFQTKFRNEKRSKSGILRTKEFIMKDLYSFSKDEAEHKEFYGKCADAYMRIFTKLGIGDKTYRTFASGGAFSEFSDEFQVLTDVGEDVIYVDKKKGLAVNKEIYSDEVLEKLDLEKGDMEAKKASEVGNIFTLGKRFSQALDLKYTTKDGDQEFPFMGSYGIGPARLLGVIVEIFSKADKLILPPSVAPYKTHLIMLTGEQEVMLFAEDIYQSLKDNGVEVLFDDTDETPGEKLNNSDLLGIPYRIVISKKTIKEDKVEVLNKLTDEVCLIDKDELLEYL